MIFKTRQVIWILFSAYIIIVLHDIVLYPGYPWNDVLFVALLRLLVPVLTLYLTYLLRADILRKRWTVGSFMYIVLWIFIIPYSFYNVTQLRHISELCRLGESGVFASQCEASLWKILLPFIYSVGSLLVFFISIDRISILFKSLLKYVFLWSVFAYVSFATTMGIYSRLDTFTMFLNFRVTLMSLSLVVQRPDFWLNVFAYFFFANLFFFGGKIFFGKAMKMRT